MATGGLTPLRGNNSQVGWAKESAWGTGVLPTNWWQWRKGTMHRDVANDQTAREGDAGFSENLAWRTSLYGDFKVAEAVRARTIGCSLQAFLGAGSDTYTAPTKSTTLANSPVAGATSLQSTADLGNVGTLAVNLTPGIASQTYEVVTLDLTTRTGTGPYTYTLANSGTLKYAHTSGDVLSSASTHTFTRQKAAYDPYAVTFYRGDGATAPFQAIQYVDSVCYDWSLRSGPAGTPLMAAHSWYAGFPKLIAWGSPTVTLEGVGQAGLTGGAFQHSQAKGSWSLNGVTSGNLLTVESCAVAGKNTTNPGEWITEGLNPTYFTPGDCTLDVQLSLRFQTFTDYYDWLYNGVSTANTVGSSLVFFGAFSVTYTIDAVNSLAISVPNARYVAAPVPEPDESSNPVSTSISLRAMTNPSNTTPFTITLCNSQNSQY